MPAYSARIIPPEPTLSHDELRAIRNRLGLDEEQMAAKIGLALVSYRNLEQGTAVVSLLVENAVRLIEINGGPELREPCAACGGTGSVRRPVDKPHGVFQTRRHPCDACHGEGTARTADRVIA